MGNITLQTIADRLGVSRTTVSNAFNRPDQLSDDLRSRIIETAHVLGYTGPHPAARTLRRGRAGALGIVLTESLTHALANPYSRQFLVGIANEIETKQVGLYLIPCPPGAEQETGVREAVVDGFCVFTMPDRHPVVEAVVARNIPTVFVDGPELDGHSFVGIDDRSAISDLARSLVALGHRRVDILSFRLAADNRVGPIDGKRLEDCAYRVTRERLIGATSVLSDADVDHTAYEIGEDMRWRGRDMAFHLLAKPDRPSAIMCLSDEIGLGVLDAANAHGLDVPADLSVTGFDGVPEAISAGLTTIRQPSLQKGARAIQLLEGDDTIHELLPYTVESGSSTARFAR